MLMVLCTLPFQLFWVPLMTWSSMSSATFQCSWLVIFIKLVETGKHSSVYLESGGETQQEVKRMTTKTHQDNQIVPTKSTKPNRSGSRSPTTQ